MPYKDPEVARIKGLEYHRQWEARHPEWRERRKQLPSYKPYSRPTDEAHAAHMAVYRAIKKGALTRPSHCQQCGRSGRIEAAHTDYSRHLDVLWLCRPCHRALDAADPNRGTTTEPRKGRVLRTAEERRAYRTAWARADRAKRNPGLKAICSTCGHHKLSLLHKERCS